MPVFAVVPLQRLDAAKSRLSDSLSPAERRTLVIDLLDNVLYALTTASRVSEVIVVSPDQDVLERVARPRVQPLEQQGRGLNEAIRIGRYQAVEQGADALLVVLADLPWLTASEIDELLEISTQSGVTIAPDRHGHGTNVLALRPPDSIEPAFGVDSFHQHLAEARQLGLRVEIVRSKGMAFDVDTVDDLHQLLRVRDLAGNRAPASRARRASETSHVSPSHEHD